MHTHRPLSPVPPPPRAPYAGGGLGFLSSLHGMACDQLLALEMVDATGAVITASASSHPDLFKASCGGGGGNFGIVTSFTLRLVQVPPLLTTHTFVVPPAAAVDFLLYQQAIAVNGTADDRLAMELRLGPDGSVDVKLRWIGL